MKKIFASLVFGLTLASVSAPAFAANPTRHNQPRPNRRAIKSDALAAYKRRDNKTFARQRYSSLVQRVVRSLPSRLTITGGGRTHSDYRIINRPTARGVNNWTLGSHCTARSRRCK
jgi:hypothetical protein